MFFVFQFKETTSGRFLHLQPKHQPADMRSETALRATTPTDSRREAMLRAGTPADTKSKAMLRAATSPD